jgi:hypothetical protein
MKLCDLHEHMLQPILREARTDIPGLEELLLSGIHFVIVGAIARNVYCDRPRNTVIRSRVNLAAYSSPILLPQYGQ